MDIKPYTAPPIDLVSDATVFFVMLTVSGLLIIAGIALGFRPTNPILAPGLMMLGSCVGLVSIGVEAVTSGQALRDYGQAHTDAYENYVSKLDESLSNEGFKIISGTPNLNPNTQSSMLLSYEGKSFDCTLFSPKDVSTSIVFSCGEAKLNLTQIKQEAK